MVVTSGAAVVAVVAERMRCRQGWSQEAMPAPLPLGRTLPVRMPTVMVVAVAVALVDDIVVSECSVLLFPFCILKLCGRDKYGKKPA
jgi:hypothetical protein